MSILRHFAVALVSLSLLSLPVGSQAQSPGADLPPIGRALVAGKDFTVMARPVPPTKNRVDVVYFFWYGSPWSANMDRRIRTWAENAPPSVMFTASPAVLSRDWVYGARVFYALRSMSLDQKLSPPLMQAIQSGVVDYSDPSSLRDWLSERGVNMVKFRAAINSPQVIAQASGAQINMKVYGVSVVPTVVVGGKYIFVPKASGDTEELLQRVNHAVMTLAKQQEIDAATRVRAPLKKP